MKLINLKSLIATLTLALTCFSANAAVVKSGDLDAALDSEFYTFSSVGTVGNSFSDYLALSFDGTRDFVGSLSGTSGKNISFTAFNLVASDLTTILAEGTLTNSSPRLAFGGVDSINSVGDYFVHVAGVASGAAGYTGTLSLVSQVPEPEVYGMLLAGLGLMGFVARRRNAS
jgi:hypothetical protein